MPTTEINQALSQLKAQRDRLNTAIAALEGLAGGEKPQAAPATIRTSAAGGGRRGPRKMSAEARARIAASQRARWAKLRSASGAAKPAVKHAKTHRTHSEATKQRIAAAAKARWARIKGNKK